MKLASWISVCCLSLCPCSAVEWNSSFGVDAGFRYDELSTDLQAYNDAGTLLLIDQLRIGSLHIYELGLNGIITLNRNLFLTGNVSVGTVANGTYFESVINLFEIPTKAKVKNGYTRDVSVGVGYLFQFTNQFRVGPVGGWSYDFLHVAVHRAAINRVPNPPLDGLAYSTRWRGPWTGLTGEYVIGNMLISAGYEYHWADWEAEWRVKGPDHSGGPFSETQNANQAFGQVVFLKFFFNLRNGWDFNAGINYQRWNAKDGHSHPKAGSFAAVGLPDIASERITKVVWKPLQIRLGCNYQF